MPRQKRRERRDGAVHQPGQARLNDAQEEQSPLRLVLLFRTSAGRFSWTRRSAVCSCCSSASARSPSSLRMEASEVRETAWR